MERVDSGLRRISLVRQDAVRDYARYLRILGVPEEPNVAVDAVDGSAARLTTTVDLTKMTGSFSFDRTCARDLAHLRRGGGLSWFEVGIRSILDVTLRIVDRFVLLPRRLALGTAWTKEATAEGNAGGQYREPDAETISQVESRKRSVCLEVTQEVGDSTSRCVPKAKMDASRYGGRQEELNSFRHGGQFM